MTRRAEQIPLEDDWVLTKVWSKSRAAPAILAAIQQVPRDEAFIPALSAGPAFDSPEAIGSAQRIPGGYHVTLPPLEQGEAAQLIAPPNCEGFAHAGEVLAHAQHEAAVDGDECTNGVCLMTRGSD